MSHAKNTLLSVIGILFFLSASLWLYAHVGGSRPHCDVDSMAYIERADFLTAIGSFCNPVNPELPYYGLGYPLFLAGLSKLFGQSRLIIVLAQLLLTLLNFFIIRGIATHLFGSSAGLIAFFLACTSFGYIIFAQFILTELLLATLLAASFYYLLQPHRLSSACNAGLLLGLSVIVKPVALYFTMPLVAVWLFIHWRNALAFLFCFWLMVGGLFAHNYYVFNSPLLGSLASINLCYWFYPYLLAHEKGTHVEHERAELCKRQPEAGQVMPELIAAVKAKPFIAAWYWGFNMFKTAVGLYATNLKVLIGAVRGGDVSFFKQTGSVLQKMYGYLTKGASERWVVVVAVAEAMLLLLRYLFVVAGLWKLFLRIVAGKSEQGWQLFLAVAFLGYFIVVTGHDGCARFRMMIEFLLIVLAAGGLNMCFISLGGKQL
jgi:hypothetical protein